MELEAALETTNAANMDIQRNIARLQQNIRQAQVRLVTYSYYLNYSCIFDIKTNNIGVGVK